MPYWTAHTSGLKIDAPDFRPDPTQGHYWNLDMPGFRYRECLPKLWEILGTKDFVWCFLEIGINERLNEEDSPLDEWELNVPASQILAFIRTDRWSRIIHSESDDWNDLLIYTEIPPAEEKSQALVRVPLPPGSAKCLGLIRSKDQISQKKERPRRKLNVPRLFVDDG